MDKVFSQLSEIIKDRKENPIEGSYTFYLFEQGLDKILKKLAEECAETIIAAKNGVIEEICAEACDLIYHLLVMLEETNTPLEDIINELSIRTQKIGNLKTIKNVDKHT